MSKLVDLSCACQRCSVLPSRATVQHLTCYAVNLLTPLIPPPSLPLRPLPFSTHLENASGILHL
eukprot:1180072-Prorocentrum_minimum.AAC.4